MIVEQISERAVAKGDLDCPAARSAKARVEPRLRHRALEHGKVSPRRKACAGLRATLNGEIPAPVTGKVLGATTRFRGGCQAGENLGEQAIVTAFVVVPVDGHVQRLRPADRRGTLSGLAADEPGRFEAP